MWISLIKKKKYVCGFQNFPDLNYFSSQKYVLFPAIICVLSNYITSSM